jgi:hypothetical protein
MAEVIPLPRPIRWDKLRSDEAERVVHKRAAKTENIIIGIHAFDRIGERGILQPDVYRILRDGYVEGAPKKNKYNEWEVTMIQRMRGARDAGVVTIILNDSDQLFVKTVEWMDDNR